MKICPKCQAQLDDDAVFCHQCGSQLAAASSQTQNAANPILQPQNNVSSQSQQTQSNVYSQQQTQNNGYAQQQAQNNGYTQQQAQNNVNSQQQTQNNVNPQPYPYNPPYDPYDHTSEFDPKDISDNKVMAMLVYLMGWLGIVLALLAGNTSPYAAFHVRQALKFEVVTVLMGLCSIFLFWTFIVPIAAAIMTIVFFVIRIICFFQICSGKAKEPPIIRSLGFLK